MTNTKKTILKILGGLVIAYFAITAIASTGTVVDDKGKPIKGAFVTAYWNGDTSIAVQPHSVCYHLEATTTDENGRFRIPIFSGNLNPFVGDRQRSIGVFVPGYRETYFSDREHYKLKFAPLEGTKSEQFEMVNRYFMGAGCGNEKAQLPMLKARHVELVKLAESKEEQKICDALLFGIEYIEFGKKIAEERRMKPLILKGSTTETYKENKGTK
jgi:hypothetical protein